MATKPHNGRHLIEMLLQSAEYSIGRMNEADKSGNRNSWLYWKGSASGILAALTGKADISHLEDLNNKAQQLLSVVNATEMPARVGAGWDFPEDELDDDF